MNIKDLFGISVEQRERQAIEIFQICEYENSIWLTYNGAIICPMSMFDREPIEALIEIRNHYVKRNTQKL